MPLLRPQRFEGVHVHHRTRRRYAYVVSCQIAIDGHGRESIQVRGQLVRDGLVSGFLVSGQPDRGTTFVGRERQIADDCIAVACDRDASSRPWGRDAPTVAAEQLATA